MRKPAKKPAKKNMIVDQILLLKILRADAECRAAAAEHMLAQHTKTVLVQKLDPEGRIAAAEAIVRETAQQLQHHQQHAQTLSNDLLALFGIDISQYQIDDETGELTLATEGQ